jgi:very-short-patch-repair endonuclease
MKKYIKPTNPKKANTSQPDKTNSTIKRTKKTKDEDKITKRKIYKSQKVTPSKNGTIKDTFIRKNDTPKERKHPEYGTSKLEERFAKNFLDKLGLQYQTQFKAESIGRYYDFYIPSANLLIEIQGSYWHGDPRLYESNDLNNTQKRSQKVDTYKYKWALEHKINLCYFWEKDINENPSMVMKKLEEVIKINEEKTLLKEKWKKRPNKN